MGLLDHRDGWHGPGGDEDTPVVYRMRAGLLATGHDYWVETTAGETRYQVGGDALRPGDTVTIRDAGGEVVARMRELLARTGDAVRIERPGRPSATVRRAEADPVRLRFVIEADDLGAVDVHGDVVDHEYAFEVEGARIAEVSKRWMTVRDTFGVRVAPGADAGLVLAAAAAIEGMSD